MEYVVRLGCSVWGITNSPPVAGIKGTWGQGEVSVTVSKLVVFKFFCFFLLINLFIFGCVGSSFLCEGFLQLRRAGATLHHGAWASHCRGLSLWSTGSRRAGSVVVAHGPSCSAACGILPDQGSNPCPLHRQADSQPLCHQGSPRFFLIPYPLNEF